MTNIILLVIMIPITVALALFLHEFGHELVTIFFGGKLQLIIFWILKLERIENKLTISFNTEHKRSVVAISPVGNRSNLEKNYFFRLIGGPLFSLMIGFFFIMIGLVIKDRNHLICMECFLLGGSSIGIFLPNIIPYNRGISSIRFNDINRIIEFLKKSDLYVYDFYAWKNIYSFNLEEINYLIQGKNNLYRIQGLCFLLRYYRKKQDEKSREVENDIRELFSFLNSKEQQMALSYLFVFGIETL